MSVASSGGGGDFRVGDVLSRSWTLLSANFLFFIALSALVYAVIIAVVFVVTLIAMAAGVMGGGRPSTALIVLIAIVAFATLIFAYVAIIVSQGALLFGAFQNLRGQPVRIGESLRKALGRLGALVGIGLLSALAMLLGLILLVFPAVMLFCMWVVAVPVCMVEGLGATASMSRSAALTKGYRWKILGIFALIFLGRWIAQQLVQLALTPISPTLGLVAGFIMSALLSLYGYAAIIMTYHDLRVAKEGVDTTQIASVFD
jgi:hypothetical protein